MINHPRMGEFLRSLAPEREPILRYMREYAEAEHIPIVSGETEEFLGTQVAILKPRRILELGTAIGYSAVLMSLAGGDAPAGIITVESSARMAREARRFIDEAGMTDSITLIEKDIDKAFEDEIPADEIFDLIFLDAAKGQYLHWLPEILKHMGPGSVLIADNVLQEGMVLESRYMVHRRARSTHRRMREFLYRLKSDKTLTTTIIPLGDGVSLSVMR